MAVMCISRLSNDLYLGKSDASGWWLGRLMGRLMGRGGSTYVLVY